MAADSTHHLLIDGPAEQVGCARRAWPDGGPHAELAGAADACVGTPGDSPPATPRRPALRIGFEARDPRVEAVETSMADGPGPDAELIRHGTGGDVGERRACGGGGCGAGEPGRRGAHSAAHGEDGPDFAGADAG